MHPRVRLTLMTVATLALLSILAFVLFSDPSSGTSPNPATEFAGSISPAAPPQDFALHDQDGRLVRLSDERGHVTVLTFMYSTCQNDCPTMAQQIRGAIDDTGGDVPVLAVSVDPKHDTPETARRFVAEQHLLGRMHFLLGNEGELQRVWRRYGIQPQTTGREHSAYVILVDKTGRARVSFPISELTPEGLAHDIRVLWKE
ncbi:MAG TPA: SCO family protein [Solirubrobacteraceae bacterium]|nr:SCO family protein [Solirubrobacteraceae bacterium]